VTLSRPPRRQRQTLSCLRELLDLLFWDELPGLLVLNGSASDSERTTPRPG
jgi:hypothetical protein